MDDIYRKLREWLHEVSPNGFRQTDKAVEIEFLKYLFTVDEARLALHLPIDLKPLETIAENAATSIPETEKILDHLYVNGIIRRHLAGGKKSYAALPFFPGILENIMFARRSDKKLVELATRALKPNWIPSFNERIGTSRTVPVMQTIPAESSAMPYQNAAELIKKAPEPIVVFPCHCRADKEDRCNAPMEVCLAFGDHAQFYLDAGNNPGRRISVEEALQILQTAEDAGLIHQFANYTDDDLSWMCNCCKCCCFNLSLGNRFFPDGKVRNIDPSAYIALIKNDICTGCGLCVDGCPVHALEIQNEISVLKPERCIGCGQCVIQCPVEAISLVKRDAGQIAKIPKNWRELIDRQHAAQTAGK